MIKAMEVYLVTNGNGLEAIEFYKEALGASIEQVNLFKDFLPDCPTELENYKRGMLSSVCPTVNVSCYQTTSNTMPYDLSCVCAFFLYSGVPDQRRVWGILNTTL